MEFPSTGEQCAELSCKQLDFLPLQCKCGKVFCTDHYYSHLNTCLISKILDESELKNIENVHVCSQENCNERSVVGLICNNCGKHFCIKHRHIECVEKSAEELEKEREKYAEPVRRFNKAKAAVDQEINDNLAQAKKNPKTRSTANKIQLMRIKAKATGSKAIPTIDRLYFNVVSPKNNKTVPIFVSKHWTIGRSIDAIAQEVQLANNNHKSNEKKLRLFKGNCEDKIEQDMSVFMKDLIESGVIVDGDELIVDYID